MSQATRRHTSIDSFSTSQELKKRSASGLPVIWRLHLSRSHCHKSIWRRDYSLRCDACLGGSEAGRCGRVTIDFAGGADLVGGCSLGPVYS